MRSRLNPVFMLFVIMAIVAGIVMALATVALRIL